MAETLLEKIKSAGKWIALAAVVPIVAIAGYLAWLDNKQVKKSIIQDAQGQILETGVRTAQWVSGFFNTHSRTLESLAENPNIRERAKNKIQWKKGNEEFYELTSIFNIHKDHISSIYLLDNTGNMLDREPFKEGRIGTSYASRPGVARMLNKHESYVSEVFLTRSGNSAVSMVEPVFYDNEFVGMLIFIVDLKSFNKDFFKQSRSAKESKVWVLDHKGRLVVHPQYHHVAENPLVTSKKEFKDHELTSYTNLIENMNAGKENVGIYQTVCFADETHEIIKKYIGFTPIQIGNKTWSVAVCRDYNEILKPIYRHTRNLLGIGGLLALLFGAGGIYFYRSSKKEAVLKAEADNLRKIAESAEVLRESEEKYRLLVKNLTSIVYKGYKDWSIEFFDEKIELLTGYTAEEFNSKRMKWNDIIVEEDIETVREIFIKALKTDKSYVREYRIKSKAGSIHWIEERGYIFCDNSGEIEYISGIFFDKTETKKLEAQLQQAQKLESIGILAGGIAHDFNNLLAVIMGNISLAEEDIRPETETFENLKEAEKAALRAKELTNRLITFSKGGTLVKEVTSIVDLVNDSVNFALKGSNINCEFSIPDDVQAEKIDRIQMKQVIQNITINAREAMNGKGAIKVYCQNVTIGQEDALPFKDGKYVKISINDHGLGIPEENLTKIFDPYFSTKEMSTDKGQGLGLTICHSIVENHDGFIAVESEVGVGTTFTIYLPAAVEKIVGTEPVKMVEPEKPAVRTGRILVMDDEEAIRRLSKQSLKRFGYDAELAKDGAEAIELYKKAMESGKPFEMVILDLTVKKGMGGKDTVKELLRLDPQVKTIVSSGYSNDPVVNDFKKYGFLGTLPKPYQKKDLSDMLSQVLGKS